MCRQSSRLNLHKNIKYIRTLSLASKAKGSVPMCKCSFKGKSIILTHNKFREKVPAKEKVCYSEFYCLGESRGNWRIDHGSYHTYSDHERDQRRHFHIDFLLIWMK
jgi:hypothetical protein